MYVALPVYALLCSTGACAAGVMAGDIGVVSIFCLEDLVTQNCGLCAGALAMRGSNAILTLSVCQYGIDASETFEKHHGALDAQLARNAT